MGAPREYGVVVIFALLCVTLPFNPGWAFKNCKVTQLDTGLSKLPMEGSDPVVQGSNVYMAYTTHREVVFLTSTDDGRNFTEQRLDDGTARSASHPRIAADKARVYVTWATSEGGIGQVMFRESTDHGASFGPQILLGQATNTATPEIAANGLGVTVVFVGPSNETILASSADGGKTWPLKRVLTIPGITSEVSVGRLGQQIVAGWSEQIGKLRYSYIATSADGGAHYVARKLVQGSLAARERLVAVSSTTGIWYIYAMDQADPPPIEKGHYGVLFTSQDGGSSWTRQIVSADSHQGAILVSGSTVYLAWLRILPDGDHVYLTFSTDSGKTWNVPRDLSGPIGPEVKHSDEVYLPGISVRNQTFSVAYASQGSVFARSTHDISRYLSAPITLGPGSNAMIGGGNLLWLGPEQGQGQPVFYARCR